MGERDPIEIVLRKGFLLPRLKRGSQSKDRLQSCVKIYLKNFAMSDESLSFVNKINQMKKVKEQRQASKALVDVALAPDAPDTKQEKSQSHLKCFAVPGLAQAQVMARIGKVQGEAGSHTAIACGVTERVQNLKTGDWQEMEMILHSQIAMLNTLAAHFMNKALGGYDAPEVLKTLPQLPSELATLSLKCQQEMRKCIALLHEIKNPKKPSQFIKTYVNQQLNQLQTEQQELKQRLEASTNAPVDIRSARTPETIDTAVEAVGEIHGAHNLNRESC